MKSGFGGYHPLFNFLYFAMVLFCSMYFMHPICLILALAGAITWMIALKGRRALRFLLIGMLPLVIVTALLNPAFNHQGVTILTYLPSGNPLTLEAIAYGLAAAAMLVTVIAWFSCYHEVMTSDKFIYLFGRVIPAMSLLLSMALGFVPRFKAQIKVIANAQRALGHDVSSGSVLERVRHGVKILSIMVTWVLESSIETADSMKSRGYGLPGRTAYSNYRIDSRDRTALGLLGTLGLLILLAWSRGDLYYRYFPSMRGAGLDIWSGTAFLAYLLLCFTPVVIECWEARKWTHFTSKL